MPSSTNDGFAWPTNEKVRKSQRVHEDGRPVTETMVDEIWKEIEKTWIPGKDISYSSQSLSRGILELLDIGERTPRWTESKESSLGRDWRRIARRSCRHAFSALHPEQAKRSRVPLP